MTEHKSEIIRRAFKKQSPFAEAVQSVSDSTDKNTSVMVTSAGDEIIEIGFCADDMATILLMMAVIVTAKEQLESNNELREGVKTNYDRIVAKALGDPETAH